MQINMKKLVLVLAIMISLSVISCESNNSTTSVEAQSNDSTLVDTLTTDSIVIDTLAVDSI